MAKKKSKKHGKKKSGHRKNPKRVAAARKAYKRSGLYKHNKKRSGYKKKGKKHGKSKHQAYARKHGILGAKNKRHAAHARAAQYTTLMARGYTRKQAAVIIKRLERMHKSKGARAVKIEREEAAAWARYA